MPSSATDAVSEGVHGGRGGQFRRQVDRDLGVVDGQLREHRVIPADRLAPFGAVCRPEHRRHLGARIGCRDGNQGLALAEHHPLPHPHRAATPHGDDDLDLVPLGEGASRIDRFPRNVRFYLGELGRHPAAKGGADSRRMARCLQTRRTDKQNSLTARLGFRTDAVDRPAPEKDARRIDGPAVTGRAGGPPSLRADRPRSPGVPHPGP